MSLPILTPSDFTGPLRISQNQFADDRLALYITEWESYYLRCLLNDEAYNEILAQSPLEEKYTDLINGATWTDSDGDIRVSTGLINVLKHFVYYRYMADNWLNTPVGITQNKNENSTRATDGMNAAIIKNKHNRGVDIWLNEVLPFISEYQDLRQDITGFTDDGGGLYTILTASTKYLADGDIVSISNDDYTVANLVTDTSFEITASGAGLTFSGYFIYEPYKDYNLPILQTAWL